MDSTALVLGLWEHSSHNLQHTQAFIANYKFDTIQASSPDLLEEVHPAGLVLFHPLSGAQNLTVSVLVYCDCHQNSYIFILPAPVPPQIDAIYIDIWISSALQGAVAPCFYMDICFLVQLTDGGTAL